MEFVTQYEAVGAKVQVGQDSQRALLAFWTSKGRVEISLYFDDLEELAERMVREIKSSSRPTADC